MNENEKRKLILKIIYEKVGKKNLKILNHRFNQDMNPNIYEQTIIENSGTGYLVKAFLSKVIYEHGLSSELNIQGLWDWYRLDWSQNSLNE